MYNENKDLEDRLTADQQAFYDEFNRDAETNPTTAWGKERSKAKRRDITNRARSLPMDFIESIPYGSYEKQIIEAIDQERFARESNDIAPGIIKDGRLYRCSKFIPGGDPIKAVFADEQSARDFMDKVNQKYDRLCR